MEQRGEHLPHSLQLGFTKTSKHQIKKTPKTICSAQTNSILIVRHDTSKLEKAVLTGTSRVWRIGVGAVVTSSTGANGGCSRAGAAVGWTRDAETVTLFGLEGAWVASWEKEAV